MSDPSGTGIEHPLEPEVVVEYLHPDGETGESEGEVWDCWGSDPPVYEILDLDEMVRVRIAADDIITVVEDPHADDGLRADGSGEPGSDQFGRPNEGEVTLDPSFVCEECGFANVRLITANGKPAAKCTECGQGYLATEDDSL